MKRALWMAVVAGLAVTGCTQESQNKLGRAVQNLTGSNGVVEVYAGEKLVRRFIKVDKLSTAYGTEDNNPRAYRYGYGYLDANFNFTLDKAEDKKLYFEVSDYSTNYLFFENPVK